MAETAVRRRAGQGALRRQGPRRLRRRARRRHRPHRHPHAVAARGQPRAGAEPGRSPSSRARSPSGTPARAPTCSGSPSHRATRPPRSSRRPRRSRSSLDPGSAAAAWRAYPAAGAFLAHLAERWLAAGGLVGPARGGLAPPARRGGGATLAGGRGSVLCVPDRRDVARLDAALTDGARGRATTSSSRPEPARPGATASSWPCSRGTRRIVVGTRAAAFAPVHDLGLVAIWDDGDDLHAEPRAPYPHAREVLLTRAQVEDAAALVGGFARSVEAEQLLTTGWAHELAAPREALRAAVTVSVTGATDLELERDPLARAARMPKQVTHAAVVRPGPRPGARPHATTRVRRVPGLRALPYAGPVRGLHRPARGVRADRPAGLPLVRHRRRRVGLRGVRSSRPPGTGGGGASHRRGAGPRLRLHPGRGLRRRPRRGLGA